MIEHANDIYGRQSNLCVVDPHTRFTVVGCGGTGFWVALFLAMSGAKHLNLFDPDYLSVSNLNRLPFSLRAVGRAKTALLKILIRHLRPACFLTTNAKATNFSLSIYNHDVIFDCTDRSDAQAMLYRYCQHHSCCYIRCGYDGMRINVTRQHSDWSTGEQDGYTINPSWVVPAVIAAAYAVANYLLPNNVDFMGDFRSATPKVK